MLFLSTFSFFFFFNDTATTEIYTLSLHDALPICLGGHRRIHLHHVRHADQARHRRDVVDEIEIELLVERRVRSEEHTSELQSHSDLVCRLLLEKKKNKPRTNVHELADVA